MRRGWGSGASRGRAPDDHERLFGGKLRFGSFWGAAGPGGGPAAGRRCEMPVGSRATRRGRVHSGKSRVTGSDEVRLEAARKAGAAATYNTKYARAAKKLVVETRGGVFAAIDFVGSEASFAFANASVSKQRRQKIFRAVPVPRPLIPLLTTCGVEKDRRLWPWCRTTGWKIVRTVMLKAGIPDSLCKPKALRHAFAVEAGQKGIALNIVQRWLGHARIETTAIYASAIGDEERNLARRAWSSWELAIPDRASRLI
jgi:Phage integrase family